MKRVAGNSKLYRNLLERFVDKHAATAREIADALETGDRSLAERQAHTIKGVAGNLGIGAVQETAGKLEKAIREGNPDVSGLLTDLDSAITSRVQAIRNALGANGHVITAAAVAFDAQTAENAIRRLKGLIEASDGDAADAVQEVSDVLAGTADAKLLAALRNCVEEFDFADAMTTLDEIAGQCHLSLT